MYPRLKLARNLLTEDGVIFISIDDNELENLKKICNEIFNEVNCIETFLWNKSSGGSSLSNFSRKDFEYVLCYSKNITKIKYKFKGSISKGMGDSSMINKPNNYSKLEFPPNSIYFINNENGIIKKFKEEDLELYDDLIIENSRNKNKVTISAKWKWSQNYLDEQLYKGTRIISKTNKLRLRYIKNNEGSVIAPTKSITKDNNVGFTVSGSSEIVEIFGNNYFDYPKPVSLLKYLIEMIHVDNNIILDFFSGSSSTAHSVMKLNSEDDGNRRFIMVQIPEATDEKSEAYKAGFKNICEIGKERIRRAGDKIVEESGNKDLDIGFKVFKLDSSNLEKWDPDYNNLEQTLLTSQDNIKQDRTQEDLIYEIMLKYGIDLTLPIEKYEDNTNTIYSVGFGTLLICLDNNITKEIASEILKLTEDAEISRVVFKDNGFNSDSEKTNIKEILKTNNIDEFITI